MISVWVKEQADGTFKVIDQVTGKVYGTVNDTRIAKGLSGPVQHGEFAGSPSRLCYKHSCIPALAQVSGTNSPSAKNHAAIVRASSSTTSASVRPEDARTCNE
jgi:hypothetical protein